MSDATIQAIVGLIGVIFGTFASKVLDYLKAKQQVSLKEKEDIIEYLNKSLEEERARCTEDMSKVTIRLNSLEQQVALYKTTSEYPVPYFNIDATGKFQFANKASLNSIFNRMDLTYQDIFSKDINTIFPQFFLDILKKLEHECVVSRTNDCRIPDIKITGKDIVFIVYAKVTMSPDGITPFTYEYWCAEC